MKKLTIIYLGVFILLLATFGLLLLFLDSKEVAEYKQPELVMSQSVCEEVVRQRDIEPISIYEGQTAEVDFSTYPEAKLFYTAINSLTFSEPNFAGHYVITFWGCGTDCVGFAIVDSITGEIAAYVPANEEGNSYSFDLNSRLLVLNPKEDFEHHRGKTIDQIIKGDDSDWDTRLVRRYYELVENSFVGKYWLRTLCSENALDGIYAMEAVNLDH